MRTKKRTWLKLLVFGSMLASTLPAHAYYDPGVQRWLNRDPLGDIASLPAMTATIAPGRETADSEEMTNAELLDTWAKINANLYAGINNNPIGVVDLFGLSGCHIWDIHDENDPNPA